MENALRDRIKFIRKISVFGENGPVIRHIIAVPGRW
jgi:hypothetical protein